MTGGHRWNIVNGRVCPHLGEDKEEEKDGVSVGTSVFQRVRQFSLFSTNHIKHIN